MLKEGETKIETENPSKPSTYRRQTLTSLGDTRPHVMWWREDIRYQTSYFKKRESTDWGTTWKVESLVTGAYSLWGNLDTRKTNAWKTRSHCSHDAVGCCYSSHRNYPFCLDAFKRVVESAKAKLFCCQLQSQRLELLECVHSTVRRWVNFAHAEKNEHGVLWRDLPLQFDRNESMQYGVLSLWLCLYVECVECVCSMWKFY